MMLGLIPARRGSVRLPDKNLRLLAGKSLVRRAVECARGCESLTAIAVSTEDEAIAAEAITAGAVHIARPPELATAETPMLPVLRHAYDFLECSDLEAIVLLQPTSPLRTSQDIVNCIELCNETGADAVVSVTDGGSDVAYHVRHARRLERIPHVVIPNGAVYVLRVSSMLAGYDWFSGETYAYEMPKDRSIDIDTAQDFEIARIIIEARQ